MKLIKIFDLMQMHYRVHIILVTHGVWIILLTCLETSLFWWKSIPFFLLDRNFTSLRNKLIILNLVHIDYSFLLSHLECIFNYCSYFVECYHLEVIHFYIIFIFNIFSHLKRVNRVSRGFAWFPIFWK